MGTDQKWIQRSLIMSSVVLFMRGPKKALRIYMETYKTPEAMKWSISNLQSVSTNVWPCYTWDFRCETKEQKHLGRLYSLLFSIYTCWQPLQKIEEATKLISKSWILKSFWLHGTTALYLYSLKSVFICDAFYIALFFSMMLLGIVIEEFEWKAIHTQYTEVDTKLFIH